MSRQALNSIYETAIASRPATRQLLNEITNSHKNVEEFKRVYFSTDKYQYPKAVMHLEDLLEKAKEQKIGAPFLHIAVERAINDNKSLYEYYIVSFIIIYFMRIQKLLSQRDIFKYKTIDNLLEVMSNVTSNRQKKSTKGATVVKQEIPGLIYEDDNLLVVEPQSWAFSRRYFGAPHRRSLVNSNKIIEGATWCTAASDQSHWHKYIVRQQNHLYYFVQKSTDELFAIRTAGGGNESVKASLARLLCSTLGQEHDAYLYNALRSDLIAEPEAVSEIYNKIKSIERNARDAQHYIRQLNEEEFERIITIAKELKIFNYRAYTEYFTMEARDQQNKMISTSKVYDTLSISEDWIRKNLKFFDILDQ